MYLNHYGRALRALRALSSKTLLGMRLTFVLLTLASLQVTEKGLSQKISLSEKNVPLENVLNQIERQTGLLFWYDHQKLDLSRNMVDIHIKNASLDEVLKLCLKDAGITYKIVEKNIILQKGTAPEQADAPLPDKPVKGKVTDEKGKALQGVSVQIKGAKKGTVTDADGYFTLNVNEGEELVFSMVGYKTYNMIASASRSVNIQLNPDAGNLEDVVIVGYGSQKQVNLTGAVATVKGDVLESRPITRLSQGLQGVIGNLNITTTTSGGDPSAKPSINIRGYTGLSSTGPPLVVIDGVPGGDINALNPNDIESISVLKDAASSSIYGSSAPYGVLMITTKTGKRNKPATVSYNNNLSWSQPINLPKMLNSLDFANLYNDAFVNAGRAPFFDDATIQRIKDYQAGKLKTETIKDPQSNNWYSWDKGNANNDFFKIYFRNWAPSQQHNINVSGGNASTTYYVGLGYTGKGGLYNYGDDKYKRYNIKSNLSTDINKWISFNLRGNFSRETYNTPNTYPGQTGGNYMHQIARKFPTVPLHNPDGGYSDASNVLLMSNGGRFTSTSDAALVTGEFVIKPLPGWDIVANYTFDGTYYNEKNHVKTVYITLPDGSLSPSGGTFPNSLSENYYNRDHQVINAYTSYEKRVKRNYFKVLGGYIRDLINYKSLSGSNTNLYSDNVPSLNLTYGSNFSSTDLLRQLATEGFFGRLNYNFDEKYLLELDGRYDATSRFLPSVRWQLYGGVSAGYNMHKEKFWRSIEPYVNTFKIRGSYGSQGDQSYFDDPSRLNYYPFYPALGVASPNGTNWLFGSSRQAYTTQPGLVDPSLTWAKPITMDIGVDAGFLNNRLSASFDWYSRKIEQYIGPSQALPAVLGTAAPVINNTQIETKGFELTINWSDKIGKLNYHIRGVLSDYTGKVLQYPNPTKLLSSTYYSGAKIGEIWGYVTEGLFKGTDEVSKAADQSYLYSRWTQGDVHYKDLNGDGKIDIGNNTVSNPGDRKVIGNNTPRYAYGFTLDAEWKGFDFSIFLQGIAKRDAWVGSNYFWGVVGDEWQSSPFTVHTNRWTTQNPNGYFPKYYMSGENGKNTQTQTRYLQNASYMRIKNLQLGYSLPRQTIQKLKLQRVRVYVSADNLATFTKLIKTMDPELSISDAKIYPLQRTLSAGLNVTF